MTTRRRWPWIVIIVLQIIQVCSLLPWLMMAGLAVMAFDSPESTEMWQPWAFVLTIWSYPIWLILAAIASWVLVGTGRQITALVIAIIFTLPTAAIAALFFGVSIFGS